jgi:hypothetical protein
LNRCQKIEVSFEVIRHFFLVSSAECKT